MRPLDWTPRANTPTGRRGTGIIELMIAITLFTVVLLSSMAMVESGRRFSRATMHITTVEDLAQQMLFRLEKELAAATGVVPVAQPIPDLPLSAAATDRLDVGSTSGFPPSGILLVDRGTPTEERISYEAIEDGAFLLLGRGAACTAAFPHTSPYTWAGLAEPIEQQGAPPANLYDGRALGETGPVFFRGNGFGFVYRIPVDPNNANNPLTGETLNWGAVVPGIGPTTDGWMALVFTPKDTYDESVTGDDINRDGDTLDVFDVGQIRRRIWSTTAPANVVDVGLGPSNVIQERCAWGSDLDNDGFEDPIFLWDEDSNLLEVRLFVLGRTNEELPIVRRVQSAIFLRNEPEL